MNNPLRSLRKVPAVHALAEPQMGGFLILSVAVGIGVGIGAAALVKSLEFASSLVAPLVALDGGSIWSLSRAWILAILPLGFLVSWWVASRFAPEISGDGVPAATEALLVHGGYIRRRVPPLKLIATTFTLGLGGSGGREGPIVQIGAGIGSWLSRRFHLGEDQVRSLVAAGAGAGIGAAFNAPIAGMLFALEVILVSFAPRHMSAVVLASVAAAVTSQSLVGAQLSLDVHEYSLNSFAELGLYFGLAVVVIAVGYFFLRFLDATEGLAEKYADRLGFVRPLLAGLVVAGAIFLEPALFGTGQAGTNFLLVNGELGGIAGGGVWWVLILLAVAKAVVTSFTISSGGSGGAFMPSLFMGAAVGTGFAVLAQQFWQGALPLDVGAFTVVGMAAMFAVVGRAPLTAILIVFEVTGANDYGLILPLMLTAVLGTFIGERLMKDSVYTLALRRKGVTLIEQGEVDILDTVSVGSVMATNPFIASPDMKINEAEQQLHAVRSHGVPVVKDDELVGIVSITDMSRTDKPADEVTVGEVMTPRPVTVGPETPVSRALERMAALGVGRLPVVSEEDPRKVVGMFRREEAVRAYHRALSNSTDNELHRQRLAQRTEPGAGYYDFRIPGGSIADGRKIREVSWPEGSTLVAVRRGREVMVPTGDTALVAGDVVTAFGTETGRRRMIDRLNSGADEPTAEIPIAELKREELEENGPDPE